MQGQASVSLGNGRTIGLFKGVCGLPECQAYCARLTGKGACSYLQRQIPRYVHMRLVVVHPDLGYPERVPLGVEADVAVVGLLLPLDVSHPRARKDLHAATAEPHLEAQRLDQCGSGYPRGHCSD